MRAFRMLLPMLAALAGPALAATVHPWVQMAPGGGSVVRVLTEAQTCPVLHSDGGKVAMTERAAPATLPVRPNKAGQTEPAAFPTRVC